MFVGCLNSKIDQLCGNAGAEDLGGLQLFLLIDSCNTLYFTENFIAAETEQALKKCCSIFPTIRDGAFFPKVVGWVFQAGFPP